MDSKSIAAEAIWLTSADDGTGNEEGAGNDGAATRSAGLPLLTSFDLPVFVNKPDTALKLLGSAAKTASIMRNDEQFSELFLRPGDPFHHSVFGDRKRTNNLLIRVTKTTGSGIGASASSSSSSSAANTTVTARVVGIIDRTYRYESLADFQYIPSGIPLSVDGQFVNSFLSSMVDGMATTVSSGSTPNDRAAPGAAGRPANDGDAADGSGGSGNGSGYGSGYGAGAGSGSSAAMAPSADASAGAEEQGAAPRFPWVDVMSSQLNLPPLVFSKIDKAQPYHFKAPKYYASTGGPGALAALRAGASGTGVGPAAAGDGADGAETGGSEGVSGPNAPILRLHSVQLRHSYSLIHAYHQFEAGVTVPSQPRQIPPIPSGSGIPHEEMMSRLTNAFRIRPVWTLTGLGLYLGIETSYFRFQMPAVAYFCRGGAYRMSWMRLGFDPRSDPNSRIFQPMEVRVPTAHWALIPLTRDSHSSLGPKRGHGGGQANKPKAEQDKHKHDKSAAKHTQFKAQIFSGSGSGAGAAAAASSTAPAASAGYAHDGSDNEDGNDKAADANADADADAADGDVDAAIRGGGAPWKVWCGTILVRRSLLQIIDLCSVNLPRLLAEHGFVSGSGVVSKPSDVTGGDAVYLGASKSVNPLTTALAQEVLSRLPAAEAWDDALGWLSKPVLERVRKSAVSSICLHLESELGSGNKHAAGDGTGAGASSFSNSLFSEDGTAGSSNAGADTTRDLDAIAAAVTSRKRRASGAAASSAAASSAAAATAPATAPVEKKTKSPSSKQGANSSKKAKTAASAASEASAAVQGSSDLQPGGPGSVEAAAANDDSSQAAASSVPAAASKLMLAASDAEAAQEATTASGTGGASIPPRQGAVDDDAGMEADV